MIIFLHLFVNNFLHGIINMIWPDILYNNEICNKTNQTPIEKQIKKKKGKWLTYILSKPRNAIEICALDWNPQGSRKRGRPKITWKRNMKNKLHTMGKT
ncbi:hypothetical protein C0J52_10797 [Blattella germanica]|nr:hypothetical protein C0J52_10797 [Blattella germanica]